jgi:hypothetical protein
MGLDMYLTKTKRVKELQVEDYAKANNALPWEAKEYDKEGGLKKLCPEIEGIEQLDEAVHIKGESFKYMTIKEEVGYWRKANHIHNWFVEKCQDGIDECQLTEVTQEQLEDLLETCYQVVNKKENPEKTLPTASGFFFGGTNYDQYYYDDIKNTIRILEETINKTDWDKEIVFYQSSW